MGQGAAEQDDQRLEYDDHLAGHGGDFEGQFRAALLQSTEQEGRQQDAQRMAAPHQRHGDARETVAGRKVEHDAMVDAQQFDMTAKLGFLFTAFKDRIEAEIGGQLDALLGTPSPTSVA